MPEPITVDVAGLPRVGHPKASGRYRVEANDFRVEEVFEHALDGAGEHLWLWIEKTGLTTHQAIDALAEACGVSARLIGFSGQKDRHARTFQWLSLPWPIKSELPVWPERCDLIVHMAKRHGRKLKRGAHSGNRFVIRIRDIVNADDDDLAARAARIAAVGVPNYFGEQRFGREGTNVELARQVFAGKRLARNKRSIALSAARSFLFNDVLGARVADGTWARGVAGDVFMLAGTNSVFASATTEQDRKSLETRIAEGDIAPTGPMPGRVGPRSVQPEAAAGAYEARVFEDYPDLVEGLVAARVDAERRSLVLRVNDFALEREGDDLVVRFGLESGAFATSVLRELGDFSDAMRPGARAERD